MNQRHLYPKRVLTKFVIAIVHWYLHVTMLLLIHFQLVIILHPFLYVEYRRVIS